MAKSKVSKDVQVNLPAAAPKETRTFEEVQKEFTALCVNAGNLAYQIFTQEKDLELMNNRMRELNFEAAGIKGKEAKQAEASKNV